MLALILVPAGLESGDVASANGHVFTIKLGSCQVVVRAVAPEVKIAKNGLPQVKERDTKQGRADAKGVAELLLAAVNKSKILQTKVKEACATRGGKQIVINVFRNSKDVFAGAAITNVQSPGWVHLDVGDLETAVTSFMRGPSGALKKVARGLLMRVLAHEIDHLLHVDGNKKKNHNDPRGKNAFKLPGPAVSCANSVLNQLGLQGKRETLAVQYIGEDKKKWTDKKKGKKVIRRGVKFKVGNKDVYYLAGDHLACVEHSSIATGKSKSKKFILPETIPYQPCPHGSGGSCYPSMVNVPALRLDFPHGTLGTGALVPKSCITGGRSIAAHAGSCNCQHLHDKIEIKGLGSFAEDRECGHGCEVTVAEIELSYSC